MDRFDFETVDKSEDDARRAVGGVDGVVDLESGVVEGRLEDLYRFSSDAVMGIVGGVPRFLDCAEDMRASWAHGKRVKIFRLRFVQTLLRVDNGGDEIEKRAIRLSPCAFLRLSQRYPLELSVLGTREIVAFDDRLVEVDFDDALGFNRLAERDEIRGIRSDFEFFE